MEKDWAMKFDLQSSRLRNLAMCQALRVLLVCAPLTLGLSVAAADVENLEEGKTYVVLTVEGRVWKGVSYTHRSIPD
ncbi:MAG: hypothetical protein DWQ45_17120 [Planctomycetota bacterium]|nr:MAG: hypothetical protein DWQ41_15985 [Planctomycetota bacterium]REK32470.1 MAG: hypothetical protein DWQ45_17120 [Planctomycetota bacterium]